MTELLLLEGDPVVGEPELISDSFTSVTSLFNGRFTPDVRGDVLCDIRFSFELERQGVKFNLSREVDGKLLNFSSLSLSLL